LQCLIVNSNDDDARIHSALAAEGEPNIKRALLDVLDKQKAGTLIAADSGISEERQTNGRRRQGNRDAAVVRKPFGCSAEGFCTSVSQGFCAQKANPSTKATKYQNVF
jgi:hypothetical protein